MCGTVDGNLRGVNGCDAGDKDNDEDLDPTTDDVSGQHICKGKNEGKNSPICGSTCDSTTKCCDGDAHPDDPLNPGGTNSNCPAPGKCGSPCDVGTQQLPIISHGRWICEGIKGGDNSDECCDPIQDISCDPKNGVCGIPCEVGTKEGNTNGTWICKGVGGGDPSGTCPIDGECKADGCSRGTLTLLDSSIPIDNPIGKWRCLGVGGGKNAPDNNDATKPCPRDGQCSDSGCLVGNSDPDPIDPNTTWECKGIGGGIKSPTCGDPSCNGSTTCCQGEVNDPTDPNHNPLCPLNGKCGTSPPCSAGTFDDNDGNDGNDPSQYICKGINKGRDSNICKIKVDGDCASTDYDHGNNKGTCKKGNPVQRTSTQKLHRWQCDGINGGTTKYCEHEICDCSECTQPPAGVCEPLPACACADDAVSDGSICGGNSSPNALNPTCCAAGYFHPSPEDSSASYEWTCAASPSPNGPSAGDPQVCKTNINCSKEITQGQICTQHGCSSGYKPENYLENYDTVGYIYLNYNKRYGMIQKFVKTWDCVANHNPSIQAHCSHRQTMCVGGVRDVKGESNSGGINGWLYQPRGFDGCADQVPTGGHACRLKEEDVDTPPTIDHCSFTGLCYKAGGTCTCIDFTCHFNGTITP